jgi:hypothetical protein
MKSKIDYYLKESYIEQESIETIEKQEYIKLQKRLNLINYLFQYLVPTLFVIIILIR